MRKLLLASAAVLGASVGMTSLASAQTTNLPPAVLPPAPTQGGIVTAPGYVSSANNN